VPAGLERSPSSQGDVGGPPELDPNPEAWERSTAPVSGPSPQRAGVIPSAALSLEPGSFIEQYEIIRELGKGGMGRVFLARDTRLARLCAIKVLLAHTGEHAARFLAEARATARCKHESIVIIHEVDETHGYPYMVLEYLEGRTLRAWMTERERGALVPPRLAAEIVIPVVRALVCAHEMGIVHRDLKPENIVLTDLGQVKVLDFGIAKRFELGEPAGASADAPEIRAEGSLQTGEGSFVGTPQYMSPEQWLGLDIDPQSDLWAAGIILHELVTGSHPLATTSSSQLVEVQRLDVPMPSVQERYPGTGALGAVIDRCLKKHKSERMGSAKELLGELESLTNTPRVSALPADDNPFAGLSAFQESDAARFFGRNHDIAAVLGRLRSQQLVVVAGPSGAGKSSFVRAGLLPALKRAGGHWESFILRPGRRPLSALADVFTQVSEASADAAKDDEGDPTATLRSQPGSLGTRLRARCRRAGSDHHVLLFVDQFEELYTLGADPGERAAFLSCLEGVADDPSSPLRVVLAVRSDFLDRVVDNRHFMTEVTRGLVLLPPMDRDGLRDAVTRPVEAGGYRFEGEELVELILRALERTRSPLPLLQFTATKLWEARDRDRKLLSLDSYHALGGVAGALSAHADSVLATLSAKEQRLARTILLRLVTPERTVRVWKADGTGDLLILRGHQSEVSTAVFSPDGARIITASMDRTVRLWNADGAGKPLVFHGHRGNVYTVAFSPDGKRIVTVGIKAVRIWNADGTGEPLVFRGRDGVSSAAWSPDGKRIVTAEDKTVRVWSADGTGELLALRGGENGFWHAAWSPDGKRIVAASSNTTVWVWTDLEPLHGIDDPRLWTATTYCMSVARRLELLHVSEATAGADQEACVRRVDQARAPVVRAR